MPPPWETKPECNDTQQKYACSPNFVFVRGKVIAAVATAAYYAANGYGPYNLSCADIPGTADYILTPPDVATLNAMTAQFSAEIDSKADAGDYATFSLGVLYDKSKDDLPFNLMAYLTSAQPYGPNISLELRPHGFSRARRWTPAQRAADEKGIDWKAGEH